MYTQQPQHHHQSLFLLLIFAAHRQVCLSSSSYDHIGNMRKQTTLHFKCALYLEKASTIVSTTDAYPLSNEPNSTSVFMLLFFRCM